MPFTNFRADEDFLAFRETYDSPAVGVIEAVSKARLAITNEWKDSLKFLGNCCYAGIIPARLFTRVAFFDPKTNPEIAIAMMDGSVNPFSYKFAGNLHRAYTRWLFGDPLTGKEALGLSDYSDTAIEFEQPRINYWEQNILNKRDGVQVINLKGVL